MNENPLKTNPNPPVMRKISLGEKKEAAIGRDIRLATAKRDCDRLRWDLKQLGLLTEDDPLWALLTEKMNEADDLMTAEFRQV